jgi:DNA-binding transcriptional LysR family regulator
MELHHLRTFREVVRERSFTAAARNLLLTQPAVSQQVKALETELGERLLHRDGRDVRPTDAGKTLLEAAERVFALLEDATKRIREARTSVAGRLTIACGDTVALYLLPPALTEFRRRFPQAEVSVRNHDSRAILELVVGGEADLGVVTAPASLDPALEKATLLEERLVLAVPPGHRLAGRAEASAGDVSGEDAVLLARPAVTRSVIDRGLRAAGATLRPVMESGNLEVVKAYVARGVGVSILPSLAVAETDRERFSVLALPGSFPRRRLLVLRRRDRFHTRLAREFTKILAAHAPPARRRARGGTAAPATPERRPPARPASP